jgi:DNA-damage-inducible protein J
MKIATVRARVKPELKDYVEHVLNELGLSFSDAIGLFLTQVKLHNGLPFDVRLPNKTTLKTFAETDKDKNLVRHKNAKEMFDKLGM